LWNLPFAFGATLFVALQWYEVAKPSSKKNDKRRGESFAFYLVIVVNTVMIGLQLAITGMLAKWEYGASSLSSLMLGEQNV
jgi:hypothetical protein